MALDHFFAGALIEYWSRAQLDCVKYRYHRLYIPRKLHRDAWRDSTATDAEAIAPEPRPMQARRLPDRPDTPTYPTSSRLREHQDMRTQTKDGQQAAADTTSEQPRAAADTTTHRVPDLMAQLVRQGMDISLRSVQVWADVARQLGSTALGSPARATMVSLGYDLFENLLATQRHIVDELVAAQYQSAQQFFDATASVRDDLATR